MSIFTRTVVTTETTTTITNTRIIMTMYVMLTTSTILIINININTKFMIAMFSLNIRTIITTMGIQNNAMMNNAIRILASMATSVRNHPVSLFIMFQFMDIMMMPTTRVKLPARNCCDS